MKRFIYAAGLLTLMACPYLYGQRLDAVANVPFDFQLGETLMPAGKYLLHEAGPLLELRGESGKKNVMCLTLPTSRWALSVDPKLEFNRYGDDYFLATVWSPSSHEGFALRKSKREKELASRVTFIQTASIPLQAR
jgi:hypothetical protein